MERIRSTFAGLLFAATVLLTPTPAIAGGVVECNRCPSTVNAAISKGPGITVVVDFESAKLTAYDVEYDKEFKRWRTLRVTVPAKISAAFYRVLEAAAAAPSSQPTNGHPGSGGPAPADEAARGRSKDSKGGLVVTAHPDDPQFSNPTGIRFPDAYKNFSASDIVMSATSRTRFGREIALDLAGANTTSAAWNSVALTLQELALSWGSLRGAGSIIVMVNWRDGSRTVYRVSVDNVGEAKYVTGESRDGLGNKFPDATIATRDTAPEYAGNYYFGEGREGSRNLERWIESARLYGVPIGGSAAGRNRMSCSWNGETINCSIR